MLTILATATSADAARSLTLREAVELALRSDPLVAQARVANDRGKLAVLRAQLDRVSVKVDGQLQELWNKTNIGGPQIDLCTIGGVTFRSDPAGCIAMGGASMTAPEQSPSAGQGLFNLAANVNVPVFSGLRVESNVSRAQRQEQATLVGIRQARRDTALAVARAYWAVRRLGLLLEVQAAATDRLKEAERVAEARVQAGLAPPIDRNRATLRRLQLEATLADLAGQAREAAAQLGVSLGLREELVLVDPPEVPPAAPPSPEALLAQARGLRPEVQRASLLLESQKYVVRMARSGFFPQLGVFGLFQFGNNPFSVGTGARGTTSAVNPFSSLSGNLTLGATLSMNFFDMLSTYTSTRDAQYEEARLLEERRRAERAVESDVRLAQTHLERLYARRVPLQAAREVARDNLSILEGRYQNGEALVIEFLDAQVELVNAEQQLADVTAQLRLAWLELEAAMGKTLGVGP